MKWYEIAKSSPVRRRAFKVAIVVGIFLMGINHGDKVLAGEMSWTDLFKIVLTFFVPYTVSTYSSVLTWADERKRIYEQIQKERASMN